MTAPLPSPAAPRPAPGGPLKKLDARERQRLVELVLLHPGLPRVRILELLREELDGRTVSRVTAYRYLRELGLARLRGPRGPRDAGAQRSRTQQGRPGAGGAYPSDLTDAQWARVSPLFEQRRGAGRPPEYGARAVLDALSYMARSGCSWRMLPHDLPPWRTVYATWRRWEARGLLEELQRRLGARGCFLPGRSAPSEALRSPAGA
ncbi:transposase [Aggregicoccus sp. 17bor-14]|uniref:transposase n=1 Tax=Myxococcaceae TaxID=31 RepID=UPI00129C836F|nr:MULTISPECIES: transposase [Myxococcaceae]MBF5046387.1 transposase [Simulacricoccus sp. 17bor-14]MRI92107.1 transposase [Aggregicoccus sp. 17bor-14]